ncbi:LOW QUALITY PROTEIN: hypothetical protein V1477_018944 [Vespula maculifrons]|uniref:Uncharacterized protein n=1 Tax=Vespula maculifrons TaxID=7453 RepID=A0ABD2ATN9_VESMC
MSPILICHLYRNVNYWFPGNSFQPIKICNQSWHASLLRSLYAISIGIESIGSQEILSNKSGFAGNMLYKVVARAIVANTVFVYALVAPVIPPIIVLVLGLCRNTSYTIGTYGLARRSVPPSYISCYPATNPDLSERIFTEPIAGIPTQRTCTLILIGQITRALH